MSWLLVVVAGLLESVFAVALKASDNFTRPLPTVVFLGAAAGSFSLLAVALKTLPVGTAYAVWTGIGAAGTAIVGIAFLHESAEIGRLVSIALIVVGVVGLRLAAGGH